MIFPLHAWTLILSLLSATPLLTSVASQPLLSECTEVYKVVSGDFCWKISNDRQMSLRDLMGMNPGLSCHPLTIGTSICVKGSGFVSVPIMNVLKFPPPPPELGPSVYSGTGYSGHATWFEQKGNPGSCGRVSADR